MRDLVLSPRFAGSVLLCGVLAACSSTTPGSTFDAGSPPADGAGGGDIDAAGSIDASTVDAGGADASTPAPSLLARTPPMGWNSWNRFGCDVSEDLIKQMADAMVATGMKAAGYQYVVIDDCWQVSRDASGVIVADAARFPSGIPALAEYIHAKGLKFGIYTDAGAHTCQNRPGSRGHELLDAQTYASWGVDYIKEDWCDTSGLDPKTQYAIMHDALATVGRSIVFSLCSWGNGAPWVWGSVTGQLWRTTGDIADNWGSMIGIVDSSSPHAAAARPGAWNDPDMLEVGNGGMTDPEYRVHFTLWAMMAAPLISGNDLRSMTTATRTVLLNPGVIAIDQDPLGIQGMLVRDSGGLQVWSRPLAEPGARAVALVNRSGSSASITVNWSEIGLAAGNASVRDLWLLLDNGPTPDAYTAIVPSHSVVLLRIVGNEPPAPTGTAYVSDLPWTFAVHGYGPAERDHSNGEQGASDGHTLTLGGTTYAKGIGAHSGSLIRVNLGGRCSTFSAKIGVDDEMGDRGSLSFEVWSGADRLYSSGLMTGATPTKTISVDVTGRSDLRLYVDPGFDNYDYDHADWAEAQVTCQ